MPLSLSGPPSNAEFASQQEAARQARRFRNAVRAAALGITVNLALTVVKAIFGLLGNSQALLADAVHSGADVLNSSIVMVSLLIGRRPADYNHPYGHGRAEAFASNFSAVVIAIAAVGVAWDSWNTLRNPHEAAPALAPLLVALGNFAIKVPVFLYVANVARATRSKSVAADARDHLLDVLSSLVVVAGIVGARLGVRQLDPIAGMGIAVIILLMAVQIVRDAAEELMDTTPDRAMQLRVAALAREVPGVRAVHAVAGRTIAGDMLIELHVDVDPQLRVQEAARIVDRIKARIIDAVEEVSRVVVELNSESYQPEALRLPEDRPHRAQRLRLPWRSLVEKM
jgi:cation diffusion facilitator family transporter